MAQEKTYTIIKTRGRNNTKSSQSGTLVELTKAYGYTLESGNSYNSKISREPKTAKALVRALNSCVSELQKGSYSPDYYDLGE